MPIGENAESRARDAISAKDPKAGEEMQQVQTLQSSIQEIQGERMNNLRNARASAEGDARENQAMLQAAELATIGGVGATAAGIENATPVGQTSPQTQALLSKYGVGRPKHQSTTSRSVQQTPQKITINNTTTNNTTNNVAVPAANIGGPVQGRTLAIKQNPDQGQARFKTWISNAFAKQNQAAQAREKEYQRREWSLSRTTGKLMKKLQELGTTISERMDPRKMAATVGGHFKTLLFLFGTMFLAKNWKKVITTIGNIENFFLGEKMGKDERGRSGLAKMLIRIFGGNPEDSNATIGKTIKDFFYTGDLNRAGVFDLVLEKIKHFFEIRGEAIKTLEIPKLDVKDIGGTLNSMLAYLGDIFKIMLSGPEAAKKQIKQQIGTASLKETFSNDIGRKGNGSLDGSSIHGKASAGAASLFNIDTRGRDFSRNYLEGFDLDSNGNLKQKASSSIAQARDIDRFINASKNEGVVSVTPIIQGFQRLKDAAKNNKHGRIPIEQSFIDGKLSPEEQKKLVDSGDISTRLYKFVVRPKTEDEYINQSSVSTFATNIGKDLLLGDKSLVKSTTGFVLGTGSTANKLTQGLIELNRIPTRIATNFLGVGEAGDLLTAGEKAMASGFFRSLENDKIIDLVPVDEYPELPEGWSDIRVPYTGKEGVYLKEITPKVVDKIVQNLLNDDTVELDSSDTSQVYKFQNYLTNVAKSNNKEVKLSDDYEEIKERLEKIDELSKRQEQFRIEEEQHFNTSNFKKSVDNISEGFNSAINAITGNSSKENGISQNQQKADFVNKMREAYSKKFDELGLDKKYVDALVAQDAYESTWGTSNLARENNNFGGIRNGNKGWQSFKSLDDYIDYKVNLLNNPEGRYNAFSSGEDVESMINRVSGIYAPPSDGNKNYPETWTAMYNQVQGYKPLSTEEIKSLRRQGKEAEADMASSSWESIESVLRRGGVTDFVVTSEKRKPGEAGVAGSNSYHTTANLAIDIVPKPGTNQTFEGLKQQMLSSPIVQDYFKKRNLGVLDETTKEALDRTGGTGPHFHIGPDNSSVRGWLAWNDERKVEGKGQITEGEIDNASPLFAKVTEHGVEWGGKTYAPGTLGSDSLLMAQLSTPKPIEPDAATPGTSAVTSGETGYSSTYSTATNITGGESNTNELLIALTGKVDTLIGIAQVAPKGQLAEIEAINSLGKAFSQIQVVVDSGSGKVTMQPKNPYTGSPGEGVG